MSPGDQIIAAFISSFFDVFVAVLLGAFEAVVVPILGALPGVFGIGG
ncbi:MAG TPA: hypothetical protein P5081_18010 [Phycisphaerae bacterium]|nr:hypothetical protein [Phycisphaerae bacterium]HRW54768.1 hypothetical protein [Phycisphaerae bacterium]